MIIPSNAQTQQNQSQSSLLTSFPCVQAKTILATTIAALRTIKHPASQHIRTVDVPTPVQRYAINPKDLRADFLIDTVLGSFARITLKSNKISNTEDFQVMEIIKSFAIYLQEINGPHENAAKSCLQKIADLIDKSFKPKQSHPGSLLFIPDGWSNEGTNTINIITQLNVLLSQSENWSEGNALHFKMFQISSLCVIGQLIEDFLCNSNYKCFQQKLQQILNDYGFPHVDEAIQLRPTLRSNPIINEIPFYIRKEEFEDEQEKTIEKRLTNSSSSNIQTHAKAISSQFTNALLERTQKHYLNGKVTGADLSPRGIRGRSPTHPDIGRDLHPHLPTLRDNLRNHWNANPDKRLGLVLMHILAANKPRDQQLKERRQIKEACVHRNPPTVELQTGSIDPLSLTRGGAGIHDPQLKTEFRNRLQNFVDLRYLTEEEAIQAVEEGLEATGKILISICNNPKLKMPLEDAANFPSVVGIIQNYKLATMCGPSGTTVDVIGALVAKHGTKYMTSLLQPLYDMAYATKSSPIIPGEWQNLLQSLGFFMQAGGYHTVAEVLAGLFIGAESLCIPLAAEQSNAADKQHPAALRSIMAFDRLMARLAENPELMMGISFSPVKRAVIQTVQHQLQRLVVSRL